MVFAGLVVSAVAVLLAIFTKLPQAGGGLTNNLMVMRYYLSSAPQLPPTPPPRAIFFLETRKLYKHHPKTFGNTTQGPMPRHHSNPRLAVGSNKPPPTHAYFSIPTFSLPFPSQLFLMMTQTIGKFALMFIALSLPWLAATGMTFLAKDVPATKHARANNLIRQTDRRRFLLPIQRILPKRTCPSHPRSSDSLGIFPDMAVCSIINTIKPIKSIGRPILQLEPMWKAIRQELPCLLKLESKNILANCIRNLLVLISKVQKWNP